VDIVINALVDLNKFSLEQILQTRSAEISKYQNLIEGEYAPTKVVFKGIKEDGYWMSIARLFYYGKSRIKASKFYNESAASSQLLNPFMLVKAEFWGLSIWGAKNLNWNKNNYPIEYLSNAGLALAPTEQSLIYKPDQRQAELDYDITSFINTTNTLTEKPLSNDQIIFGLSMQNARDLGFRYSYLDIEGSVNIKNERQPNEALDIPDRFDYMPVSWNNKFFLNHKTPSLPQYQSIQATALPATAVIKLWYQQPENLNEPADYIFKINIG
jgi:hypothetical protein